MVRKQLTRPSARCRDLGMTVRREFIKGVDDERRKGIKTAILPPACTALPFAISVSAKRTVVLDGRVKVYEGSKPVGSPVAVVAIRPRAHVVEGKLLSRHFTLLRKWIELNHDVLVQLRDGELYSEKQALASFHPIRRLHESLGDYVDPRFADDVDGGFYRTDLLSKHTGLPFVVWVAFANFGGVEHDLRIWTVDHHPSLPSEATCLAVRPEVRVLKGRMSESELELLRQWVGLNMDVLVKHWDGDIGSFEVLDTVRPYSSLRPD